MKSIFVLLAGVCFAAAVFIHTRDFREGCFFLGMSLVVAVVGIIFAIDERIR